MSKSRDRKPIDISYTIYSGKKKTIQSEVYATEKFDPSLERRKMIAQADRGFTRDGTTPYSQKESNQIGMTYNSLCGRQMIKTCIDIYKHVGIVRNIIDLMGDFSTEDVEIIHPSENIANFWYTWQKKIDLQDVINKLVITLLKAGIVVIQRKTATLDKKEETDMKSANAAAFKTEQKAPRKIPVRYVFIDPTSIDVKGTKDGKLVVYYKDKRIDNDPNYYIASYKRDDWESYAEPFHFSALDDIAFENKMQRMDEAIMDGAINNIRIWKLGGELKDGTPILPDKGAISKLAEILENDTQGGTVDIIWDPFLDLKVEYPPVDKILGSDKYKYIKQKIMEDFGIAQVLIDGTGQGSYSNQYLSIMSLMEKLKYLRNIAENWLSREVEYVRQNISMKQKPIVRFKHINLSDKNAERALVIQCVDRGIMSKEQALDYFGEKWSVEKERIKNEKSEEKDTDDLVVKGPFDMNKDTQQTTPVKNNGRPPNEPGDKSQKVKRVTKPTGASVDEDCCDVGIEFATKLELAKEIQEKIDLLVDPLYFEKFGVKNIKQLKKEDRDNLNNLKFFIFSNAKDTSDIKLGFIKELETSAPEKLDRCVQNVYKKLVTDYAKKNGKQPSAEKKKDLMSSAFAICRSQLNM